MRNILFFITIITLLFLIIGLSSCSDNNTIDPTDEIEEGFWATYNCLPK